MTSPKTINIPEGASRVQTAEILSEQGYLHQDGHHLTVTEDPYRKTIDAMCVRNPSLRYERFEFAFMPDEYGKVAVLNLERTSSSALEIKRLNIENSEELDRGKPQLDSQFVRDLDEHREIEIFRRTRAIATTHVLEELKGGNFSNVGIVKHTASFWSRKYADGGWDDRPPRRIMETNRRGDILNPSPLYHVPYYGGYLDFIQYPDALDDIREFISIAGKGPLRNSMLEDLCFYWMEHTGEIDNRNWEDNPSVATAFLEKIAASSWIQLSDHLSHCAHSLEYQFSHCERLKNFTPNSIEIWWSDLHLWHRRCVQHCEDVEAIIIALQGQKESGIGGAGDNSTVNRNASLIGFAYVLTRIEKIKVRFELLLQSATGLNSIAGTKEAADQNLRHALQAREEAIRSSFESRRTSVLTSVATICVPVAVTSGMFSMSPEWAHGGAKFGYFCTICLSLVFLLGIAYHYFDRMYLRAWQGSRADIESQMSGSREKRD